MNQSNTIVLFDNRYSSKVPFVPSLYFSFQTFVPELTHFDTPVTVSASECLALHEERSWTDEKGVRHPLKLGPANKIRREILGSTDITSYSDVQCVGGILLYQGKQISDLMQYEQRTIIIDTKQMMISPNDEVTVHRDQIALKCMYAHLSCADTVIGTFTWSLLTKGEACAYSKSRVVNGIQLESAHGHRTFISRDGSMTRFILREKRTVCDDIPVYGTDYDKIVLVEVKFAHRFINDISSPEVSLATYSNNKDEFLYGSLTDFIKQVYLAPNKLNTGL